LSNRRQYHMVESLRIPEADFHLRRMHVDVHLVRWQLKKQKSHGVTPGHEQSAVGLLQSMSEAAVTNPTAVDEQILHLGVAALAGRVGNVAVQMHRSLPRFQGVK